jgi:hypothetical protein
MRISGIQTYTALGNNYVQFGFRNKKTVPAETKNEVKIAEGISYTVTSDNVIAYHFNTNIDENCLPDNLKKICPKGFLQNIEKRKPLGTGANSKVYEIPGNKDYVVKVLNKPDPNKINVGTFPDDINVGQPVWQSPVNPQIMILRRVMGEEHSIPNWSGTIFNPKTEQPEQVTKRQAKLFCSKVHKLASMDSEVYDDFAKKVKTIDENGYKLDSINPNNLMVDDNEISIIDFFKIYKGSEDIYQNSAYDLIAIMLDFTLFPEYYDKLNTKNKKQLIKDAAEITKKVNKASEKAGIDCGKEKFKTYINFISKWFVPMDISYNGKFYNRHYDVRMKDFLEMTDNPEQWAENRA